MKFTGVLWYQGESDGEHPQGYALRQMTMVQDWRRLFNQASLPFIYAQLPNYALDDSGPWAQLRDEQRQALALANCAMIATYDVGEDNDLHPLDKRTIGLRMAMAAEALAYGSGGESMGPVPSKIDVDGQSVIVRFAHVGKGLQACGPLVFEICVDCCMCHEHHLAGRIIGRDRIVIDVPSDIHLTRGTRLRFAYEASPHVTLVGGNGIPASPFEIRIM